LVSFDKLSGMYVICAGGFDLGNVNGININTITWEVTHLHVKLSKPASEDLGFKKRFRSSTVCGAYLTNFSSGRKYTAKQIY